jgi:hypothetical protein
MSLVAVQLEIEGRRISPALVCDLCARFRAGGVSMARKAGGDYCLFLRSRLETAAGEHVLIAFILPKTGQFRILLYFLERIAGFECRIERLQRLST